MEHFADELRGHVDELCLAVQAGAISGADALERLRDAARGSASAERQHVGGASHACPWHTCQGTLHAPLG